MEEKLLKLLKIANSLSKKQNKVYAQIKYVADINKQLEISIINKEDYTYIERHEIQMEKPPLVNWDNIIESLEKYVKGV